MSEFWKRKLKTYFSTFDHDKNGVISKAEWMGMAIGFAESEKADTQKADRIKTQFANVRCIVVLGLDSPHRRLA